MLDISRPEVAFGIAAVREVGLLARTIQQRMIVEGLTKSDASPVTVADFAGQALVARSLKTAFPEDGLVGEESADALRQAENVKTLHILTEFVQEVVPEANSELICAWIDRGVAEPGDRFWTLDPIDGTKGYLRGDQYAVALALIEHGQVQIGILGCPRLGSDCLPSDEGEGVILVAVRGKGTWKLPLSGDAAPMQLRATDMSDAKGARISRSYESGHTNADEIVAVAQAMGIEAEPVRMDSQAKYAVLAAGKGELLFRLLSPKRMDYKECIWDQAAGAIVVEEAGGKITDLYGKPLDFTQGRNLLNNTGVFASNGVLHEAGLKAIREVCTLP